MYVWSISHDFNCKLLPLINYKLLVIVFLHKSVSPKPEGKNSLGRSMYIWDDNIKMGL